jgi:hypothetical protein
MPLFYNTEPVTFCRYLTTSTIRKGAKDPPDVTERSRCLYQNFVPILFNAARRRREPGLCRMTVSMLHPYVASQPKTLRRSSVFEIEGRVVLSEVVLVGSGTECDFTKTSRYVRRDWT